MADKWTKLTRGIIHSTVWQQPLHIKIVWIAMLAMKDEYGNVYASVPGLARAAGVDEGQAEEALHHFMQPDPKSRCKDNEGRRIAEIPGGWNILNHFLYRDNTDSLKEYNRKKQAEYRARKKRKEEMARPAIKQPNIPTTYAERKGVDQEVPL